MAFGWAYVDCGDSASGGSSGPSGSLQFMTASGTGISTGSLNLSFQNNQILQLTGTLQVNGAISASQYHIDDISVIHASGSTYFGNTNDDVHARTGSLTITNVANEVSLNVNTSGRTDVRQLTVEYTPVTTAHYTASAPLYILGVQQSGQVYIKLPRPDSSTMSGNIIMVKDELTTARGGDNITLDVAAGKLIDGSSTYVLTGTMPAISLYSNGANWFVF
tara:strand:- start:1701 stop:2360 length:660 start_codon:yes stop_codon:yes gene_type:complete